MSPVIAASLAFFGLFILATVITFIREWEME